MLLEISEQTARETELAAWTFCIGICLFVALEMFVNTKKRTDLDKDQKNAFNLWVIYIVLSSIAHFLGVYSRIYGAIVYSEQVASNLDKVSIILINFASLIIIFFTERTVKPWKYPVASIFMTVAIIYGLTIEDVHQNTPEVLLLGILMTIGMALPPLVYFYIGLRFGEPVRKKSYFIGVAISVLAFGILLQRHNIVDFVPSLILGFENLIGLNWAIIPTGLTLIGVVMIYYTYFYLD